MPQDNIEPRGPCVTLKFGAGMSDAEVRENMDRLLALGRRYNTLVEELERTAAVEGTPAEKEARIAQLFAGFLADDPRLRMAPWFANLVLPLVDRLFDEAVRAGSKRSDGVKKRPAEYTLPVAIPRSYLVLAADALMRSGRTENCTKAWLRSKTGKYGIKAADEAGIERIMEWRHEIVARMGKRPAGGPEAEDGLLDLMIEIFKDMRPVQNPGRDEAEELATELIKAVRLEQERGLFALA